MAYSPLEACLALTKKPFVEYPSNQHRALQGEDELEQPTTEILTVRRLLQLPGLSIPEFQRPYKWAEAQVRQLFEDICHFKGKCAVGAYRYRLGTIVLHDANRNRWIVDGQQRILTLVLLIRAFLSQVSHRLGADSAVREGLTNCGEALASVPLKSRLSGENLRANYRALCRLVAQAGCDESHGSFLLDRCEVVVLSLRNMGEAFQFFDSQNSRGRELEPHDLLKAYHLREMSAEQVADPFSSPELRKGEMERAVKAWEGMETSSLSTLFADYLFPIRRWSEGKSGRAYGTDDIGLFKGLSPEEAADGSNPNARLWSAILGASQEAGFAYQFNQPVFNGWHFFAMVNHYSAKREEFERLLCSLRQGDEVRELWGVPLGQGALEVLKTMATYPERHRTGDRYVRTLFECAILAYEDKFSGAYLSDAIERLFLWAFSVRLSPVVRRATVDILAMSEGSAFRVIRTALRPMDVLRLAIPPPPNGHKDEGPEALRKLFAERKAL